MLLKKKLKHATGDANLFEIAHQTFVTPLFIPLIILSIIAFVVAAGVFWSKRKRIESLLIWVSMWLYLIALILLFK